MWEVIVEKILIRYLSQYVDGIEREKLQVQLLGGNVELADLTLKAETAEVLDLPFSIVYGRIGKLTIGISWTKWMSQDYDLRVSVEQVHLLLKPRGLPHQKTAAELLGGLRETKERQVKHKEQEMVEAMKEKESAADSGKVTRLLAVCEGVASHTCVCCLSAIVTLCSFAHSNGNANNRTPVTSTLFAAQLRRVSLCE